jgi:hypothetical protein
LTVRGGRRTVRTTHQARPIGSRDPGIAVVVVIIEGLL